MNREESNHAIVAACPFCGRVLFRSLSDSSLMISCPKCKRQLTVYIEHGTVFVAERDNLKLKEYQEQKGKRYSFSDS